MGKLGQLLGLPFQALAEARGILFAWVPVMIAVGIGFWFSLSWEPGMMFYSVILVAFLLFCLLRLFGPEAVHPLAVGLACITVGLMAAGIRAHSLSAPVLKFRYYGAVEGRILSIDRSQSDRVRLTLDQVHLERTAPSQTPLRVRVSLHGDEQFLTPEPGQIIVVTAHLSAPDGPVEPGGFDFRRMAFFDQLGAVGYARTPALLLDKPAPTAQRINRLRARLRKGVEARIDGDPGAFAAALVTGDRAGISGLALEALRGSNLAHLLAISGLHMGLLAGFVFAAFRYGVALVPPLALRINAKKIAALVALVAGAFYLMLSGGNVATERAFVMVAVMLGGVLLDRRALSLRSVALAAIVLLLTQPETLLEPGFQMSFAATVALVAGFGALRGRVQSHRMHRWAAPVFTLFFSSLLAGVATAPVGAAHFNRVAGYGLIANLLAVPVMGLAVMPAAVIAAVLAPVGLEGPALWLMSKGTAWILWIAETVSGWDGAIRAVPSPTGSVLPIMALGALWLVLWRGQIRFVGVVPIVAAFALWSMSDRPTLLISADGGLVGVLSDHGRVLSAEKGAGFTARQWLENDGDLADQTQAASRAGMTGEKRWRQFSIADWRVIQLKGTGAEQRLHAACQKADLVIIAAILQEERPDACAIIDQRDLSRTGPLAISVETDGGLKLHPTSKASRLWTGRTKAEVATIARRQSSDHVVEIASPN